MELMKIVLMITITMALTLSTVASPDDTEYDNYDEVAETTDGDQGFSIARASRFLAQAPKKAKATKCSKNKKCSVRGTTCCSNKCIDVRTDSKNCGMCKKRCKYTQVCCRGKCVNTNFDKRHCGGCNNRCKAGSYCIYGMCDYSI